VLPAPAAVLRATQGVVIGSADAQGQDLVILTEEARSSHVAIVGATRTGKSTLLMNIVLQNMLQGHGAAILDPHGDLARDILSLVPPERMEDVIYFDPADEQYPVAFNPLEAGGARPSLNVSVLSTVFRLFWAEYLGPRMLNILRYAMLSLMETPGATLADVVRMLTSAEYRQRIVPGLRNAAAREFWESRFDTWTPGRQAEATEPILNKLDAFLADPLLRRILAQPHSAFDLRQVMDQRKILICNLSRGLLGDENAYLLGVLILAKLQLAALSRASLPIEERQIFYIYIDEFQRFRAGIFQEMLAEAAKFKISLVTANQYLDQLSPETRQAILGIVGTLISFRVGQADAQVLKSYFAPSCTPEDLQRLDNYHAYARLMVGGEVQRPFGLVTLTPPSPSPGIAERVRELSRKRYGHHMEQETPVQNEERKDEHRPRFYE
jgi:hypothetical protein